MTVRANEMLPADIRGRQLDVSRLAVAVVADRYSYAGLPAGGGVWKLAVYDHLDEHDVGGYFAIALPVMLDLGDRQGKEHRDQQPTDHERHLL